MHNGLTKFNVMKVVLFCGGLGTRLRDYSDVIPKPMVPIGYRPILWQVMKYYAHFGHKDFILALGYKADHIKEYFINYSETISNDFVYTKGGKNIQLLSTDIDDWKITFVDTGMHSNVGMRLKYIQSHVKDEDYFLANYADGLTDMYLPTLIDDFISNKDKTASFMTYKPKSSMHSVNANQDGIVTSIQPFSYSKMWLNAGYFIFRQDIFDYIRNGEDLVAEPFQRLIEKEKLMTHHHNGFWQPMDTFKDKVLLDDLIDNGNTPWKVWKTNKEQLYKNNL